MIIISQLPRNTHLVNDLLCVEWDVKLFSLARLKCLVIVLAQIEVFYSLDRPEMVEARKVWQSTHDAGKTLAALRRFHCTERHLLEGLKRCAKNDIVTALSAVCSTFC